MTIAKRKLEPEDTGMCILKIIMFLKIGWRKINNFRYADDTPLMAESEEKLESLEKGTRGKWKGWLETQH